MPNHNPVTEQRLSKMLDATADQGLKSVYVGKGRCLLRIWYDEVVSMKLKSDWVFSSASSRKRVRERALWLRFKRHRIMNSRDFRDDRLLSKLPKTNVVFEKNQNFSNYVTLTALTSRYCIKKPPIVTKKTLMRIITLCNMYVSQKCRINTINSKVWTKILKIIQNCYPNQG